jgi:hypothetical protein
VTTWAGFIIFSNLTFNAWNVYNNNCNEITDSWRHYRLNKDMGKKKKSKGNTQINRAFNDMDNPELLVIPGIQ